MNSWKSCDNCLSFEIPGSLACDLCRDGDLWMKLDCPRCGGALSETRYHNGRPYRHCFSCHKEFFEGDKMGKKYSIKTVDGNRIDIESEHDIMEQLRAAVRNNATFIMIDAGDSTKALNIGNIVSVTEIKS